MIVHIYARHSPSCPQTDPDYKRCRCLKWVTYTRDGKRFRESTKARSWEQATLFARETEKSALVVPGEITIQGPRTVQDAVQSFLDDKRSQRLKEDTLKKLDLWFRRQLAQWCLLNRLFYLSDLNLENLRRWRSTWKDGPQAARNKQHRLRGFFKFCLASGWVEGNPAMELSRIRHTHKPTDYFTEQEFERIIEAQNTTTQGKRLRALILLMRWSGLRIGDAVTLERSRLNDSGQVFLYQAKTGVPVYVAIPPDVAEELRALPAPRASSTRFFFWTGNGKKTSATAAWRRKMASLFKVVDIRHPDGSRKRAHPQMLRDTFAVQLLICGVPLHDVSTLLGHTSIKTTERHYAPFVMARMMHLDSSVRAAWGSRA